VVLSGDACRLGRFVEFPAALGAIRVELHVGLREAAIGENQDVTILLSMRQSQSIPTCAPY
jgi:hypothetical protein